MTDLEQAWEKLGLKPGSTLLEAMEAHRDLSAVWSPERFPDNPRLQRRAAEERASLDRAYDLIRQNRKETGQGEAAPVPGASDAPAAVGPAPIPPTGHRPSLYEESLANRPAGRKIPYGWIVIGLTGLAMAIRLFWPAQEPTDTRPDLPVTELQSDFEPAATVTPEPVAPTETAPVPAAPEPVPAPPTQTAPQPPQARPTQEAPDRPAIAARPATAEPTPGVARQDPDQPASAPPPAPSGPVLEAYELLREKVSLVADLAGNGRSGDLEFVDWKPVRNQPPEIFIDVVARRGSEELHLIWAVNLDRGTVRAMSQAARDMESPAGIRPRLDRPE